MRIYGKRKKEAEKKALREKQRRIADRVKEASGDDEIFFGFFYHLDENNREVTGMISVTSSYIFRAVEGEPVSGGISPVLVDAFAIAGMEKLTYVTHVGCVSIEVAAEKGSFELCRSDGRNSAYLSEAVKTINGMIANRGREGYRPRFGPSENACPKCGRAYRPGSRMCVYCVDKRSIVKRLYGMIKGDLGKLIAAVILFFAIGGTRILIPLLQRTLVDDYITSENPQAVVIGGFIGIVAAIAATKLCSEIIQVFRSNMLAKVATRMILRLRGMLYEKIQALSAGAISKRTAGELIRRVSGDTENMSGFLVNQIPQMAENLIVLTAVSVAMLIINWKIALLILVPAPLVALLFRKLWRYTHRLYHRQWYLDSEANTVLHDVFQGIRVVKVFGMEEKEIKKYDAAIRKVADISEKNEVTWSMIMPYAEYVMGIGNYVVLLFVGSNILRGQMTLGDMTLFSYFVSMIYSSLNGLMRMPRMLQRMATSTSKVFEIIDEEPDVPDRENALELALKGEISIENITFGYQEHEDVLKNVSFNVQPGEMIGIVGRSGAGKTTLINLLMRLYDVAQGTIRIDGVDIREISQHSLRSQIGVVLQETFLFTGTLYDNIAYAKPEASRADVIRAAKLAGAHDFIMKLPDTYHTVVGERGHTLSGGERQRIAIARALLHDPRILILDEATSSLDTETEQMIQTSLAALAKNRTTLAIAHRLSTLRNATRLIVLDKGGIAEEGTHEELMRKRGIYYELVMTQREMSGFSKTR